MLKRPSTHSCSNSPRCSVFRKFSEQIVTPGSGFGLQPSKNMLIMNRCRWHHKNLMPQMWKSSVHKILLSCIWICTLSVLRVNSWTAPQICSGSQSNNLPQLPTVRSVRTRSDLFCWTDNVWQETEQWITWNWLQSKCWSTWEAERKKPNHQPVFQLGLELCKITGRKWLLEPLNYQKSLFRHLRHCGSDAHVYVINLLQVKKQTKANDFTPFKGNACKSELLKFS